MGICQSLFFEYREPSTGSKMVMLLRAFSVSGSSYTFEVKSERSVWSSVKEDFDKAWDAMDFERDSISPPRGGG